MPRGVASELGAVTVNALGYSQTRTETGWRATHHLIAEEKLGRPLRDEEIARFRDNDRTNLDPDNIIVALKGKRKSNAAMIARIEARIQDLQAELAILKQEEASSQA